MEFLLNLLSLVEAPLPTIEPTVALAVLAALVGVPGVLAGRPLLRRLEISWLRKPPSSLEDLFGSEAAAAARAGDHAAFLHAVARAKKASVITLTTPKSLMDGNARLNGHTPADKQAIVSFMRVYRKLPPNTDVVVHLSEDFSPSLSDVRILSKTLLAHAGEVTVVIPFKASGASCLIALAGHRIIMSTDAILQFDDDNSRHTMRAARLKKHKNMSDVALLRLFALHQVMRETEWLASVLLKARGVRGWRRIARAIASGKFNVDRPARLEDLKRWGLKPFAVDFANLTDGSSTPGGRETVLASARGRIEIGESDLPVCVASCPTGDVRDAMVALEERRSTRVISIVHGRGMSSTSVDDETTTEALRAIRSTPHGLDLDIILHTPGGDAIGTEQIIQALKAHRGRKTVFVPYMAFSAGTLLALTADEIFVSQFGTLGPIDSQLSIAIPPRVERQRLEAQGIGAIPNEEPKEFVLLAEAHTISLRRGLQHPARAFAALLEHKKPRDISDEILTRAVWARECIREDQKKAVAAMKGNYLRPRAKRIARTLNDGYLSHGFPLMYEEARKTGLHVRLGVPEEVFTIVDKAISRQDGFCSVIHCPT